MSNIVIKQILEFPEQKPTVVFDLDGTLADINGRVPKGEIDDFPKFLTECVNDIPRTEIVDKLIDYYNKGYVVEIWTGRNEQVRVETVAWLQRFNIHYHHLRMRPLEERCSNLCLKKLWYQTRYAGLKSAIFYDDDPEIIEYWKSLGHVAHQV